MNQGIEKYKCKVCGVNTFQKKDKNVIDMRLINKLCAPCYDAKVLKITGG